MVPTKKQNDKASPMAVLVFCARIFGSGRSTVRQALLGLFVAPFIAVLTLPVPFLLIFYSDARLSPFTQNDLEMVIGILAVTYLAAVATTIIFGMSTWLILRRLQKESGWLYALIGALAGLVPPYLALRGGPLGPFALPAQYCLYGFCAGCGMISALVFWTIARGKGQITQA